MSADRGGPASRWGSARGFAAYVAAVSSLIPVFPWLYEYIAWRTYWSSDLLGRGRSNGAAYWRQDLVIFFSAGWWKLRAAQSLGTIALAVLVLLTTRGARRGGSRITSAAARMAWFGIGVGLLGALLLGALAVERFLR